jgi:hypothetical protein
MKTLALLSALPFLFASPGMAQEPYSGPRPPKPDVPYLLHADNLVQTEVTEAREEKKGKSETAYISGAASPVRTPLAEPIFLYESGKVAPESLQLFRLEVKNGNREVALTKRGGRPLRLMVTPLAGRLYRIEVDENLGLENGEYSLSPNGSNAAFCFAVY